MEDVVLFTRQRGEASTASEQEALEEQIRVIEAFARREQLRIVDRVVKVGIGAGEMFQEFAAYLREHTGVRAIITHSTHRLSRRWDELEETIRDRGLKIYVASEQVVLTANGSRPMHTENSRRLPLGYRVVDGNPVIDSPNDSAVREAFRLYVPDGEPDGES